jgi:tetratricopeptide (TPR) repeat protein
MRRRQLLKIIGISVATLSVAEQTGSASMPVRQTIAAHNVEFMRETTRTFRRLDNCYGGGHSRSMIASYLVSEVQPMLHRGRYTQAIRGELFGAAAELYQLGGWMAYDMGDVSEGRSHLREALRLCQEVRNDGLAAEMLAGMSHHAAFNRSPEMAVDMALAARQPAAKAGLANLHAEAAVLEAHGLALQGNARGCIAALQRAERVFIAPSSGNVPPWLEYFDEAYLSAKFAHALRDLGRPADAERFARQSLEMSEGYERGRLFNTALLASVLADQGKVDEAVSTGSLAVEMGGNIRSTRTIAYLSDVGRRLLPYRSAQRVQAFHRQMKLAGILIQRA